MNPTDFAARPASPGPSCQGAHFPRAGGVIVALLLAGSSLGARAQPSDPGAPERARSFSTRPDSGAAAPHRNVLKLTPLVVFRQLSAFYERALTDRVTVVVGYGAGGLSGDFGRTLVQGGYTFQRGTLEVRRYWKNKGLRGWYAGPYLRAGSLRQSYFAYHDPRRGGPGTWQTQQARLWTPGVLLGHQLVSRWFVLDTFLGLQTTRGGKSWTSANSVAEAMANPALTGRLGLSIGVPF